MIPESDVQSLALLYHLNSQPRMVVRDSSNVFSEALTPKFNSADNQTVLPGVGDESQLLPLLRNRRSCRAFREKALGMDLLGRILHFGYGVVGTSLESGLLARANRPVPSAGALYPFDLYVLVHSVSGLREGVYIYRPSCHSLDAAVDVSPSQVRSAMVEAAEVKAAGAVVLILANLLPTLRCYGPRGYRYLLLEAGHIAQNICLGAVSQGLGSLCIGGFDDAEVMRGLKLDPFVSGILYCVAVGFGEDASEE